MASMTGLTRLLASAAFAMLGAATSFADAPKAAAILKNYGDIAEATYGDALVSARALQTAVKALLDKPDAASLASARAAWKAARVPYMQSEAFRFGNKIVDDWEGKVNAWPLDEGLIDYVDAKAYGAESDDNLLYTANVIANKSIRLGKSKIDASKIDARLIRKLHQAMETDAAVASGYHAIEFLLWGQDLNGTGPGAGNRPATDYDPKACTGGNCDRRRAYLTAVTNLLVDDLAEMAGNWKVGGKARKQLAAKGESGGLSAIVTGLGSLSYGELSGERIKVGALLHDPEEEHDCFSDNTHNSHFYDQTGIMNVWNGRYARSDGSIVSGPSIAELAREKAPDAAKRVDAALAATLDRMKAIKAKADSGEMAYDQMLAAGNDAGNKLLMDAADGLVAQARALEGVVAGMGLKIELGESKKLAKMDKGGK
jgi:putative iron-regulated protein